MIEAKCQLRIPFIIRGRRLYGYEAINIRDEVCCSLCFSRGPLRLEFKCKSLVLNTTSLKQRAPSIF